MISFIATYYGRVRLYHTDHVYYTYFVESFHEIRGSGAGIAGHICFCLREQRVDQCVYIDWNIDDADSGVVSAKDSLQRFLDLLSSSFALCFLDIVGEVVIVCDWVATFMGF
jgi:hypothetical protein